MTPDPKRQEGLIQMPSANNLLPRNGLRPSVARLASRQVRQERQWAKDGTMARLYELGRKKRAEMIRKK